MSISSMTKTKSNVKSIYYIYYLELLISILNMEYIKDSIIYNGYFCIIEEILNDIYKFTDIEINKIISLRN